MKQHYEQTNRLRYDSNYFLISPRDIAVLGKAIQDGILSNKYVIEILSRLLDSPVSIESLIEEFRCVDISERQVLESLSEVQLWWLNSRKKEFRSYETHCDFNILSPSKVVSSLIGSIIKRYPKANPSQIKTILYSYATSE